MKVKKIELSGKRAFISYVDEYKRDTVINLLNIIEMNSKVEILTLTITVRKNPEKRKDETDKTAFCYIDCETEAEVELVRQRVYELHTKVTMCACSTGIHEGTTVGYGELDDHGYWEHGCYLCARELERKFPDEGSVWPFANKLEQYLKEEWSL